MGTPGAVNLTFLKPDDAYHAYYRSRVNELVAKAKADADAGSSSASTTTAAGASSTEESKKDGEKGEEDSKDEGDKKKSEGDVAPAPPKPPAHLWVLQHPVGISALDADIIAATAQATARHGRDFVSNLFHREGGNPMFYFLKRNNPLHSYFNSLVQSYERLLFPVQDIVKGIEELAAGGAEVKEDIMTRCAVRGAYEAAVAKTKEEAADAAAKAREAYSAVDWGDFVVVDTIEWTADDERAAEALLRGEGQVEGDGDAADDAPQPRAGSSKPSQGTGDDDAMELDDDMDMDMDMDEEPAAKPAAPAKKVVRTGYVSHADKVAAAAVAPRHTQTCPRCGAEIPVEEMAEHMRIELLDPKWAESQKNPVQEAPSNLADGEDASRVLAGIAAKRADLFITGDTNTNNPDERNPSKTRKLDGPQQPPAKRARDH